MIFRGSTALTAAAAVPAPVARRVGVMEAAVQDLLATLFAVAEPAIADLSTQHMHALLWALWHGGGPELARQVPPLFRKWLSTTFDEWVTCDNATFALLLTLAEGGPRHSERARGAEPP